MRLDQDKMIVMSTNSAGTLNNSFGLHNLTNQKRSAVHDLTQIVTEDCFRVSLDSLFSFFLVILY